MKQLGLLTLTIFLSLTMVQAQSKKSTGDMVFDKTVDGITFHDYGSIIYGANGKVDFTFTNKGTKPLVVSEVKSSCGCTIPNWTKEPVAPGQKGTISIEYNTTLPGVFNKTVEVISNANNSPVRITIKGKVNTQPSDLGPAKKDAAAVGDPNLMIQTETNRTLDKNKGVKVESDVINSGQKAAQQESFKNLVIQPATNNKSAATTEKSATTPVKKK
ncbi:MAG: DUF1573 domain-containing protein [Bacteroidales bacterium]|jgi:hypothetical protein